MGEVVNVLVAFAVIVFIFRWVTSSTLDFYTTRLPLSSYTVCYLYQAVNLRNNGQQQTLWASDQRMWRKKWCVWSFFLRFCSISRIVWGSHPFYLLLRTRILWYKRLYLFLFLADWHNIQYVSGHSCVNLFNPCWTWQILPDFFFFI